MPGAIRIASFAGRIEFLVGSDGNLQWPLQLLLGAAESSDVAAPRKNPMTPKVTPRTVPMKSSCRKTRRQFREAMCPSANSRVMIVAACDPELPPVEMHSGTNRVKTRIAAMQFLEKSHDGERHQLGHEQDAQPLCPVSPDGEKARLQIIALERPDGRLLLQVLGRFLGDDVDDVVVGDDADAVGPHRPARALRVDRTGSKVSAAPRGPRSLRSVTMSDLTSRRGSACSGEERTMRPSSDRNAAASALSTRRARRCSKSSRGRAPVSAVARLPRPS